MSELLANGMVAETRAGDTSAALVAETPLVGEPPRKRVTIVAEQIV